MIIEWNPVTGEFVEIENEEELDVLSNQNREIKHQIIQEYKYKEYLNQLSGETIFKNIREWNIKILNYQIKYDFPITYFEKLNIVPSEILALALKIQSYRLFYDMLRVKEIDTHPKNIKYLLEIVNFIYMLISDNEIEL